MIISNMHLNLNKVLSNRAKISFLLLKILCREKYINSFLMVTGKTLYVFFLLYDIGYNIDDALNTYVL